MTTCAVATPRGNEQGEDYKAGAGHEESPRFLRIVLVPVHVRTKRIFLTTVMMRVARTITGQCVYTTLRLRLTDLS